MHSLAAILRAHSAVNALLPAREARQRGLGGARGWRRRHHDQRNRWPRSATGAATRAANRCWTSLQVSSIAPGGAGCRTCSVTATTTDHHQGRVGQHGQGHPPIPGAPAADLVLVQAAQPLAGLERLLHPPATPRDPHQGDQRQTGRAGAHIEGQLSGGQAAADQQPAPPSLRRTGGGQRRPAPRIPAATLGPMASADPQPALGRDLLGQPRRRRRWSTRR
jgi:hypothetical protein